MFFLEKLYLNRTTSKQKTDLQGSSVSSCNRHFDRDWNDSSLDTTVVSAQKVDGIVVGVD